jgi:hypothetical protein
MGAALGFLGGEVDTVPVQCEGDGLHALASGVISEDPAHDHRFLRLDLEPGGRRVLGSPAGCLHGDRPVAEDPASGTQPPGGAPGEPPMGLVPEVVQVQFAPRRA